MVVVLFCHVQLTFSEANCEIPGGSHPNKIKVVFYKLPYNYLSACLSFVYYPQENNYLKETII